MTDSPNQRLCLDCNEWIDARAQTCYLCGAEGNEYNHALKKAVETTRLNSALSSQVGAVRGEAAAEQRLRSARNSGRPYDGALPTAGYDGLVSNIKKSLFGE